MPGPGCRRRKSSVKEASFATFRNHVDIRTTNIAGKQDRERNRAEAGKQDRTTGPDATREERCAGFPTLWPMAYDAPCGGNGRYARPA
eukprot:2983096-Prymnesium_polylepis.1